MLTGAHFGRARPRPAPGDLGRVSAGADQLRANSVVLATPSCLGQSSGNFDPSPANLANLGAACYEVISVPEDCVGPVCYTAARPNWTDHMVWGTASWAAFLLRLAAEQCSLAIQLCSQIACVFPLSAFCVSQCARMVLPWGRLVGSWHPTGRHMVEGPSYCEPLELIARVFNDQSAHATELVGIGPAAECVHLTSALKRSVTASAAYRTVRAGRRDEGVLRPRQPSALLGGRLLARTPPP